MYNHTIFLFERLVSSLIILLLSISQVISKINLEKELVVAGKNTLIDLFL